MGEVLIAATILLACISIVGWIARQVYEELEFREWLKDLGRDWEDDGNTEE